MFVLYHYSLCPFSRKARMVLAEKKLDFQLKLEQFWKREQELLILNPSGEVPILIENGKNTVCGGQIIAEYLEETHPETTNLIGTSALHRAEVRRISAWFDEKFYTEVGRYILEERIYKFLKNQGPPNSNHLRVASNNLNIHLDYIKFLLKKHKWLCGENFSLADITAFCHLSSLDYLNEINWHNYKPVKEWYSLIKSRPSFKAILEDRIPNFPPAKHYSLLDF